MSPRAAPVITYHETRGDTEYLLITTKGTEHLITKYMNLIGEDSVQFTCDLLWLKFEPLEDSCGQKIGT